jgi:hypothetical protein
MEALQDFQKVNHDFETDRSREKYMLTFYPKGWLRKIH